ncbi:putative MFS family arabinose efflux permease [Ancylobacter aquaticus]|uniref:Putative MFS family arabinose efflux permease n=1 Tax=Ancylobacter aquaticus TaxID=100 RepID=A0A4R1I407_ANCAQ|nr:MFS transporter [Ancylobacter aquaticus]TCK30017.1 putative MFS family arabinose efflux permease [Ancylobacter aquaticus]
MTSGSSSAPPNGRTPFIIGLGVAQLCSWGSLYYSFPQIAQAMGADLGWSKAELYGAATLGLALAGLAAYPVGAAIDRGHGRAIMAGASLLAGALLVLWAQVESLALFYVAVAGIGAVQAATLYEPAFAVVARRAGPLRARAGITALTLWGGFSSTAFIPLIQLLLGAVGWRGTLLVLGAVNILVCATVNFLAVDARRDRATPYPEARRLPGAPRSVVGQVIRQPVFWALAVAFTAYAAMFSGFTFHMYPLLLDRGFDTATVVSALALIGPAQVGGRVLVSLLAPRAPVRVVGAIIVAVFPLAFLALELIPPDFAFVALFALAYGAVNGIITIVRGLVVPELLTRRAYGAVNGALAVPATLSRALAPAGMAMLWTATGSYDAVLLAVAALAGLLALGFWCAAAMAQPLAEGD